MLPHSEPDSGRPSDADLALVRGVLERQPEAAQRFVERVRCVARMLAARNRKLGSPLESAELEDVAQETIIALWSRLGTYDGRTPLEAWCWGFCRVALLTGIRTKRRRDDSVLRAGHALRTSDAQEPHEAVDDEHELLRLGLAELPRSESEVVELKHFGDLTFDDIGRRLAISANTAKTRYYRALTKLRTFLGRRASGSRGAPV
jgi:RNA polymerase sigma-70 factor (ECF subfamily)